VGIGAPANTPADVIDKLNRETNAALADPSSRQLADFGAVVMTGSPTDFRNFIAVEIDKSAKVITFVNIKAD
jgi:tripartite-type tricarboxylate transporter receptor subunit TctC